MLIKSRKFKKRKGFTIVEVIVAMAMLTVVASTSLIFLSFGTIRINDMRGFTQDVFILVHDLELQMREVRNELVDMSIAPNLLSFYIEIRDEELPREAELLGGNGIFLFNNLFARVNNSVTGDNPLPGPGNRNLAVYLVTADLPPYDTVNTMHSFIGQRGLTYPAPQVETLVAEFRGGNLHPDSIFHYIVIYEWGIGTAWADLVEYSFNEYDEHGNNIWGGVNWQWHVSDPNRSFGMVVDRDSFISIDEIDNNWGLRPNFPRDFEPILGAMSDTLQSHMIFDDFRGRHIVISATPFSNLGRMGRVGRSSTSLVGGVESTLFIIGLPREAGFPYIHFNAGIIGRSLDSMTTCGTYSFGDHLILNGSTPHVHRWNDLRTSDEEREYGAVQETALPDPPGTTPTFRYAPILHVAENEGIEDEAVQFSVIDFISTNFNTTNNDEGSPYLTLDRSGEQTDNGLTIFVVARQNEGDHTVNNSNLIISGVQGTNNFWRLGFDEFTIRAGGGPNIATSTSSHDPNEFYIISGRVRHNLVTGMTDVKHGLNGVETDHAEGDFNINQLQFGEITIGNESAASENFNASIAEIIIFNGFLDDAEFEYVVEYLGRKYSIYIDND